MPLLKLIDVCVPYDIKLDQSAILKNINLEIESGEFVVLMGANEISRNHLLKIIGLLLKPASGSYIFQDHLCDKLSASQKTALRRHKIGFVFKNFNLLPNLNVLENVSLPLFYSTKLRSSIRHRITRNLLNRLGIYKQDSLYPHQLTINQQQRIAVARALINDPDLILVNQPTIYLDNLNAEIILNILVNRHQMGKTIVLSTNNPDFSKYADRILYLDDGRLRVNLRLNGQQIDLNKIRNSIAQQNLKLRNKARNLEHNTTKSP